MTLRSAWIAALAALATAGAAQTVDRQAATTAELTLTNAAGRVIAGPEAGEPFTLEVGLRDAGTGAAPGGLLLEGWIRPVRETDLPCVEAARAFRATRRIPTNAVDLNGIALVAFNTDGSFGIADPRLDLATANMVGAGTLDAAPERIAVDREGQGVLAWTSDGTLRRIDLSGAVQVLDPTGPPGRLAGLAAASEGRFWTARGDATGGQLTLHGADGEVLVAHDLGSAARGLAGAADGSVAGWSETRIVLADAEGRTRDAAEARFGPRDVAIRAADEDWRDPPILAATGTEPDIGHILFGDALDVSVPVKLAFPADRVALDPESGLAVFWSEGGFSVVDPASARLLGAAAIRAGIGAVAFAGEAGFFLTPDQSAVLVLDMGSVEQGAALALHETRLGPRGTAAGDVRDLLVPLEPSPQVMAVNTETYTAFIVSEESRMGDAPPMTAVRLRGGTPQRLAVIDRAFREMEAGRFETRAVLEQGGPHELVLTTGIGGMSICFSLAVGGAAPAEARDPARLVLAHGDAPLRAGRAVSLSLGAVDAEGRSLTLPEQAVDVSLMDVSWRRELPSRRGAGTDLALTADFPLPGVYVLGARGPGGESMKITLEVLP